VIERVFYVPSIRICAALVLTGCGIVPYPHEFAPIAIEQRIAECVAATPPVLFFQLSAGAKAPTANLPGGCDVWFAFNPYKDELGEGEWTAAQTGEISSFDFGGKADVLRLKVTFTPTPTWERKDGMYRCVVAQATVRDDVRTADTKVETFWRQRGNGWYQVPAYRAKP